MAITGLMKKRTMSKNERIIDEEREKQIVARITERMSGFLDEDGTSEEYKQAIDSALEEAYEAIRVSADQTLGQWEEDITMRFEERAKDNSIDNPMPEWLFNMYESQTCSHFIRGCVGGWVDITDDIYVSAFYSPGFYGEPKFVMMVVRRRSESK